MKRETENLGKFIVKGSISFSTSGLIQQFFLLIQGIITYRVLSVAERGIYAQVWSIFAFAGTFTFVNMVQQIVIKKISLQINNKPKINQILTNFVLYSIISSSFFVLFFIITYFLERWNAIQIFNTGLSFPLLLASASIFFAVSGYNIVFVGIKDYFNYNLIQIISTIIHFVLCVGFLLLFKHFTSIPPYFGIFIGLILKTLIVVILTAFIVRKKYGRFLVKLNKLTGLGDLIVESLGLGLDFILYSILIDGSIIVLAIFAPEETVANYEAIRNAGLNLSRIIGLLLGSMLLSIIPAYLNKFEYDLVEKMTGYVTKAVLYLLSLIMLAIVFIPEAYIQIFNGDKYLGIQELFFVSCFQIFYNVLLVAVRPILISQKKIHILILINSIRSFIFLILSFIFLPIVTNKLHGLLVIVVITYTINIVTTILLTQRSSKVHFFKYYKKIYLITAFFVIIGSLAMFLLHERLTFLWKIPIYFGALMLYHVLIIMFGAVTKQDLYIIESIVYSFFSNDKEIRQKKWKKKLESLISVVFKILHLIPLKETKIEIDSEFVLKNNICVITKSDINIGFVKKLIESGYRISIITGPNPQGIIHQEIDEHVEKFFTISTDFIKESARIFNAINKFKHFAYVISLDLAAIGLIKYSRFRSNFIIFMETYWRNIVNENIKSQNIRDKLHGIYLYFYHLTRWFILRDTLNRSQKIIVPSATMKNQIAKDLKSNKDKILLDKQLDLTEII
ncbi:MAG: lipopolysaccharide biosynthesis protein [Candidatus Lokiarchaeota archaeon]|nr:lipopolysaccharide biosynthesis protein [Candidatus Lokiarchaeota archaeon]